MSASVIVPTHNRQLALGRTLAPLRAMDFPGERLVIVVVDSGTRDEVGEAVAARYRALHVRGPNHGVAVARNHGASLASNELLLFVDDDIVVEPSNLRQHEAIHMSHDRCLVSGHWEFDSDVRRELERSPLGRFRLRYEDFYNKPAGLEGDAAAGQVRARTLAASNLSIRA